MAAFTATGDIVWAVICGWPSDQIRIIEIFIYLPNSGEPEFGPRAPEMTLRVIS
jgi:hypothetical protein